MIAMAYRSRKSANFLAPFRFQPMPYKTMPFESVQADFRESHGKRTFIILTKNNTPLFVNPELLAIQSKDFREKYETAVAAGKNEIHYEEFNVHDMIALLESVCPTIYNTFPYPPSVYDVAFLSHAAYRLKMSNLMRVCERVLEEDVTVSSAWPAQLLSYFDAAYRCKMNIHLQARFLSSTLRNSLYGYNSDHEMFHSPTASVFLRALIQHRSGFFEHYGTQVPGEINPESPGECSDCARYGVVNRRPRRWRKRCRSQFLLLCMECSETLCLKCRRMPCIGKVNEFLRKNQLP